MKISAAWNCKNEEAFIGYSIMSVKNICDDFLVVDHGSTDRTLEVVKECERLLDKPIRIIHFPTERKEPEAKNLKYKEAQGDWVLWLDADELFTYEAAEEVKQAIIQYDALGKIGIYLMMLDFVDNFETTVGKYTMPDVGGAGQGHRPRVFKTKQNIKVSEEGWRLSKLFINGKIHQECFDIIQHTNILIYHYDRLRTTLKERYDKMLFHIKEIYRSKWDDHRCQVEIDNPASSYYYKARNLDAKHHFTGIQPQVFKEYNFCDLEKLAERSRS